MNLLKTLLLTSVLGASYTGLCASSDVEAPLHPNQFRTPPVESQIGTWWHWMNGHVTREGITRDLESMHAQGIQHVTVLNVYRPFGQEYKNVKHLVAPENMREVEEPWVSVKFASKEWYDLFRFAVEEADRLGMYVGAANCDGWSESGGPWIKPDQSMKEYVWTTTTFEGGKMIYLQLEQPKANVDFYRDAYVVAYPVGDIVDTARVVDLTPQMDNEGCLVWHAPAGQWKVIRFGYTTTGKMNHPASPEGVGLECDKMDTVALNLHFKSFPAKLIQAAGKQAGKAFRYFLVDSWEAGFQTWTDHMPVEFEKRRGYSLMPWVPALCGEVVNNADDTEAFKHDFALTCSDLILDYYFKHLADLCHRHGMKLFSEGIYGSVKLPAVDVLKSYQYCDMPMTEFWAKLQAHHYPYPTTLKNPLNYVTPQHAAQLYNKPIVASEAYTGYALYSDAPFDLKLFGDQAYSEGVSQMILHSYVHQMQDRAPGFTLGVYGQTFNRLNFWFNESRPFMEWQARQQYMLQGGVRVADALIYIGDKLPAYECGLEELQRLVPKGTKYQYINQDVLLSGRVSVRNGKILLDNNKEYQTIIIRDEALDLSTMQQLEAMSKAGAQVVGVKPVRTLRLLHRAEETAQLRAISDRMWGEATFKPAVIHNPDMKVLNEADADKLLFTHKSKGGQDIYFLVNKQDRDTLTTTLTFRQPEREALLYDPMDGECYKLSSQQSAFTLMLRPKQSVFVVFGSSKEDFAAARPYGEVLRPDIVETLTYAQAKGKITFDSDPTIKPQSIGQFRSLTESKDPSVKYYSGFLTYNMTLNIPKKLVVPEHRIYLQLPAFGCTAHVTVNGKDQGIVWDPNYQLDITDAVHKGKNQVTVRVTNPWRNRIIGDLNEDRGDRAAFTTSPGVDKYDQVPYFSRNHELIPTGISQPIVIRVVKK